MWNQGESGNPHGRPKGSRNKLGEDFIRALYEDFEQHGAAVIAAVREARPQDYLKVVASLVPKQIEMDTRPVEQLSDEELLAIIAGAKEREIP
jgi:hypothetical protein